MAIKPDQHKYPWARYAPAPLLGLLQRVFPTAPEGTVSFTATLDDAQDIASNTITSTATFYKPDQKRKSKGQKGGGQFEETGAEAKHEAEAQAKKNQAAAEAAAKKAKEDAEKAQAKAVAEQKKQAAEQKKQQAEVTKLQTPLGAPMQITDESGVTLTIEPAASQGADPLMMTLQLHGIDMTPSGDIKLASAAHVTPTVNILIDMKSHLNSSEEGIKLAEYIDHKIDMLKNGYYVLDAGAKQSQGGMTTAEKKDMGTLNDVLGEIATPGTVEPVYNWNTTPDFQKNIEKAKTNPEAILKDVNWAKPVYQMTVTELQEKAQQLRSYAQVIADDYVDAENPAAPLYLPFLDKQEYEALMTKATALDTLVQKKLAGAPPEKKQQVQDYVSGKSVQPLPGGSSWNKAQIAEAAKLPLPSALMDLGVIGVHKGAFIKHPEGITNLGTADLSEVKLIFDDSKTSEQRIAAVEDVMNVALDLYSASTDTHTKNQYLDLHNAMMEQLSEEVGLKDKAAAQTKTTSQANPLGLPSHMVKSTPETIPNDYPTFNDPVLAAEQQIQLEKDTITLHEALVAKGMDPEKNATIKAMRLQYLALANYIQTGEYVPGENLQDKKVQAAKNSPQYKKATEKILKWREQAVKIASKYDHGYVYEGMSVPPYEQSDRARVQKIAEQIADLMFSTAEELGVPIAQSREEIVNRQVYKISDAAAKIYKERLEAERKAAIERNLPPELVGFIASNMSATERAQKRPEIEKGYRQALNEQMRRHREMSASGNFEWTQYDTARYRVEEYSSALRGLDALDYPLPEGVPEKTQGGTYLRDYYASVDYMKRTLEAAERRYKATVQGWEKRNGRKYNDASDYDAGVELAKSAIPDAEREVKNTQDRLKVALDPSPAKSAVSLYNDLVDLYAGPKDAMIGQDVDADKPGVMASDHVNTVKNKLQDYIAVHGLVMPDFPKGFAEDIYTPGQQQVLPKFVDELGRVIDPGRYDPGGATFRSYDTDDPDATLKEADLAPHYAEWAKTVTSRESEVIREYMGTAYGSLNRTLRDKGYDSLPSDGMEGYIREQIDLLDSAISRSEIPDNMIVWRRGHVTEAGKKTINTDWEVGELLEDQGFVSTSLDRNVATSFNGDIFKIELPKGLPGAFLDAVQDRSEQELLLPRGSRFVLVAQEKFDRYGTTYDAYRLRYVGPGYDPSMPMPGEPVEGEDEIAQRRQWEAQLKAMGGKQKRFPKSAGFSRVTLDIAGNMTAQDGDTQEADDDRFGWGEGNLKRTGRKLTYITEDDIAADRAERDRAKRDADADVPQDDVSDTERPENTPTSRVGAVDLFAGFSGLLRSTAQFAFKPHQRRAPKGSPYGGRWIHEGGYEGIVQKAREGSVRPSQVEAAAVSPKRKYMHERVGGQEGSNTGGFYKGLDGVTRYIKTYDDPTQAYGEHLANRIYSLLVNDVAKSEIFTDGGQVYYASEMIKGGTLDTQVGRLGLTPKRAQAILDGFVGDVLTANRDVLGMNYDNVLDVPHKQTWGMTGQQHAAPSHVVRVDNGSAFLHRAQGARKDGDLRNIDEWDTLAPGPRNRNRNYAAVFETSGYDSPEAISTLQDQLRRLDILHRSLGARGWAGFVEDTVPDMDPADQQAIAEMLQTRAELLVAKRKKPKDTATMSVTALFYRPDQRRGMKGTPVGGKFQDEGKGSTRKRPDDIAGNTESTQPQSQKPQADPNDPLGSIQDEADAQLVRLLSFEPLFAYDRDGIIRAALDRGYDELAQKAKGIEGAGWFSYVTQHAGAVAKMKGIPERATRVDIERINLGITPFRGEAKTLADQTDAYYQTPRYKGWLQDLRARADEYQVQIESVVKVAGVWQGTLEPSASVWVTGHEKAIQRLAGDLGGEYNQEGVLMFDTAHDDGAGALYTLPGVTDRDEAVAAMQRAGIDGGRLVPSKRGEYSLEVADFDGTMFEKVDTLGRELGLDMFYTPGRVSILEGGTDYERRKRPYKGTGQMVQQAQKPKQRQAA